MKFETSENLPKYFKTIQKNKGGGQKNAASKNKFFDAVLNAVE